MNHDPDPVNAPREAHPLPVPSPSTYSLPQPGRNLMEVFSPLGTSNTSWPPMATYTTASEFCLSLIHGLQYGKQQQTVGVSGECSVDGRQETGQERGCEGRCRAVVWRGCDNKLELSWKPRLAPNSGISATLFCRSGAWLLTASIDVKIKTLEETGTIVIMPLAQGFG